MLVRHFPFRTLNVPFNLMMMCPVVMTPSEISPLAVKSSSHATAFLIIVRYPADASFSRRLTITITHTARFQAIAVGHARAVLLIYTLCRARRVRDLIARRECMRLLACALIVCEMMVRPAFIHFVLPFSPFIWCELRCFCLFRKARDMKQKLSRNL